MPKFWMLIPEEAYILVIVGLGFAVMLRFISMKGALIIVGVAGTAPIIDSVKAMLPGWALLLMALWFCLALFKAVVGTRVVENVISALIVEAIFLPFRIIFRKRR